MRVRYGPDGLHLFDRESGLNALLDEVHAPPEKYALAPRFVSFALTNACDLHCSFCYAPKTSAKLSANKVIKWARELDAEGCLGIGFGGGEPTLHPEFASLCTAISRSTGLSVSFTTHGHRLTPQLCQALSGVVHFLRISMDGVRGTYESIRGRSFSAFLEHAERARSICPLGINHGVNDKTIGDLDEAAEVGESLRASEMLLLPEIDSTALSTETLSALKSWIVGYRGRLRLSVAEDRAPDDVSIAAPFTTEVGTDGYMHVNANGCLSACSYAASNSIPIDEHDGIIDAYTAYKRGIG